ncbi:MAG: universal stress protein [Flavobacteriaceae bacterium]|nr:universal stress protein [Flavobacteriaceae bacterium]
MKKIIVPIDFSEHSEYALKTAAKLAKKYDAEVLALHMLEMSDSLLTENDNEGEQYRKTVFFLKLAEQKFEAFLEKPYLQDVKLVPIIKHFKVFSEVNDVANKEHADLIIMGSHGTSGFKEFFVGSNTERVVRNADIPVLVVKHELENINFEKVLFATNFDDENIQPYLRASRLFEKLGSKPTLLYVNLPNEHFKSSIEIESKITEFLMAAHGNLDQRDNVAYHADYTVEQGILNYANKIEADLIAIPTHGRKGVTHFFAGSIGEDVANHSELPVITFKI